MSNESTNELEEGEIIDDATPILPKFPAKTKTTRAFRKTSSIFKQKRFPCEISPKIDGNNGRSNMEMDPAIDVCENEDILRETRKNFMSSSKREKIRRRKKYIERENLRARPSIRQRRFLSPCPLYSTSTCPKGSKCEFLHGDYPCVRFHMTGHCYEKEKCRFSHAELTNFTAPIIDRLRKQNQNSNTKNTIKGKQKNKKPKTPQRTKNSNFKYRSKKQDKKSTKFPTKHSPKKATKKRKKIPAKLSQKNPAKKFKQMPVKSIKREETNIIMTNLTKLEPHVDVVDPNKSCNVVKLVKSKKENEFESVNVEYDEFFSFSDCFDFRELKESLGASDCPLPSFREFKYDNFLLKKADSSKIESPVNTSPHLTYMKPRAMNFTESSIVPPKKELCEQKLYFSAEIHNILRSINHQLFG